MEVRDHKKTFEEVERETVKKRDYGLLDEEGVVNTYVEAINFARRDFEEAIYSYVSARERVEKVEGKLYSNPNYHSIKKMICDRKTKVETERLKYFMHRAHKKGGRAGNANTADYKEFKGLFQEYGVKTRESISAVSQLICEAEDAWKEKEEAICTICDCGAFLRELKDSVMGGDI